MAGPIRNVAVAQGNTATANTPVLIYTVPSSTALILKSVILENAAAATGSITLYINNPAAAISPALISQPSVTSSQTIVWSGWTVLNAGDRIYVMGSAAGTTYWLAGALLPYATPPATLSVQQQQDVQDETSSDPHITTTTAPPPIYLPPHGDPAYVSPA